MLQYLLPVAYACIRYEVCTSTTTMEPRTKPKLLAIFMIAGCALSLITLSYHFQFDNFGTISTVFKRLSPIPIVRRHLWKPGQLDATRNETWPQVFEDRPDYCDKICHQLSIPGVGFPPLAFDGRFKGYYLGSFAFRDMADLVLKWPNQVFRNPANEADEYVMRKEQISRILKCLGPTPIIYLKADPGDFFENFYTSMLPSLPLGSVLITGQSDTAIGDRYASWEVLNDYRLVHWFGENSVVYKTDKFTQIPIGLMYLSQPAGIEQLKKSEKEDLRTYITKVLAEVEKGERKKLMVLNFSPRENFRKRLINHYCNNPAFDFVDCVSLQACKVMEPGSCKYQEVYSKLRSYPFWLAPSGNGLDTHRHYEAMYLNRIPIVGSSPLDPLLHDLPVLLMDDLKTITRDFLVEQLVKIRDKIGTFNLQKLNASHWQTQIEDRRRDHLKRFNITSDVRKRCWGP